MRRENIIGTIFCNKVTTFTPNFGKSHTNKTNKKIAIIIRKIVFICLNLTLLGVSILLILFLVLLLSFVFKNGRNNDIANNIKISRRISRIIEIVSQFSVTTVLLDLNQLFPKTHSSPFYSIGKKNNS